MLPTIIISAILLAAVVLALRFVKKEGTCAGCADKGNCGCGCHGNDGHNAKNKNNS